MKKYEKIKILLRSYKHLASLLKNIFQISFKCLPNIIQTSLKYILQPSGVPLKSRFLPLTPNIVPGKSFQPEQTNTPAYWAHS